MIEKLFQNSRFNNSLLILEDCTLYFRLEYFTVEKVYIFHRQDEYPFSVVGDIWVQGPIQTEYFNKGYISTPIYSAKHISLPNYFDAFNAEEVSIFGYSKNRKYQIQGVSFSKNHVNLQNGIAAKFSFHELKRYL